MIIVTGAAGFIGSNLVRQLNKAGRIDILAVDVAADGDSFRNLARCQILDLVRAGRFAENLSQFQDAEAVFHLGAISATTERDGQALLTQNVETSQRLLGWCQERSIPFLYASSASVYGDGGLGFSDADPSCEGPLNGYAFTKWLFDQQVRRMAPTFRSQVVGLRYFNVYGPQEWHKGGMCSPVLHFHRQIQAENKVKLFAGSHGFRRDFVTVEDCCAVNLWFWQRPNLSGIFNCGTGYAASFAEVAELVVGQHPGATLTEVPFPEHLRGKYQAFTCADLTRLRGVGCDLAFTPVAVGVPAYARALAGPGGGYL